MKAAVFAVCMACGGDASDSSAAAHASYDGIGIAVEVKALDGVLSVVVTFRNASDVERIVYLSGACPVSVVLRDDQGNTWSSLYGRACEDLLSIWLLKPGEQQTIEDEIRVETVPLPKGTWSVTVHVHTDPARILELGEIRVS